MLLLKDAENPTLSSRRKRSFWKCNPPWAPENPVFLWTFV